MLILREILRIIVVILIEAARDEVKKHKEKNPKS